MTNTLSNLSFYFIMTHWSNLEALASYENLFHSPSAARKPKCRKLEMGWCQACLGALASYENLEASKKLCYLMTSFVNINDIFCEHHLNSMFDLSLTGKIGTLTLAATMA